jgi:hypothetical protein
MVATTAWLTPSRRRRPQVVDERGDFAMKAFGKFRPPAEAATSYDDQHRRIVEDRGECAATPAVTRQ